MTITEVKQAPGSWSLVLRPDTPQEVLNRLTYFGHLAVIPAQVNVGEYGDNLLGVARYVGVYRGRSASNEFTLNGAGMAIWLGDEDDKGDVFESAVPLTGADFATSVAALLPPSGSVTIGTLYSVPGTYTNTHRWETSRRALNYLTEMFSTPSDPVEWRVNFNGTLDAGRVQDLYVTNPRAMIMRRREGRDLQRVVLPGQTGLTKDVEDFTTRVVILAEGEGDAIATGAADAVGVSAKDIHGNTVKFTRLVSESDTSASNADARAQLILNRFTNPRQAVELSSSAYDIKRDFVVGDYVDVWDPENGFYDAAREVQWEGEALHPTKLRCVEMTWPVISGYTVAFRDGNGVWVDLTPYFIPESGDTSITVGELDSATQGVGSEPIGSRPSADTSTPAVPVFITPFATAAYQSSASNDVRAAVLIQWTQPLNVDGSTILDGSHYEIRYRTTEVYNYPVSWAQGHMFTWDELQTWGRPLSNPAAASGEWEVLIVPWTQTQVLVQELTVAANYEFQIRAVDANNPPNQSVWSGSVFLKTGNDVLAPEQPAAPVVAGSLIAIQVIHRLGKASGGEFNLPNDLHHLEVHIGGPYFFPEEATHLGNLSANADNLVGEIPVVGTFQVEHTDDIWVRVVAVDRFGNKSSPSDPVQATIPLIDNAHISDLSVSKLTAGLLTADVLLGASIRTALAGRRVELNSLGIQLYDADGELTINLTADDAQPNFITIVDDGATLASIDQNGNITGQTVNAGNSINLAGVDLQTELLDPLPKGIVAYGEFQQLINTTSEIGVIELSFVAEEGRRYQICCRAEIESSAANARVLFQFRDGGQDEPTLTSPIVPGSGLWFRAGNTAGLNSAAINIVTVELTPGLHRILWTISSGGTGVETAGVTGDNPSAMWIQDTGSSVLVPNTAVINTGGGTAPPAITNYTKTYNATWYQTYTESGGKKDDSTANQGRYSSADGNQRSLIGFPYSQIASDLSGATIKKVELTINNEHWYYSAGGTAVIGTHDYTSEPSSWSSSRVDDDRLRVDDWARGAKKTVSLGTSIGNDFKDGDAKGIALGPGPSTSLEYYGKFSGTGASSSDRPVLKITYTK